MAVKIGIRNAKTMTEAKGHCEKALNINIFVFKYGDFIKNLLKTQF